MKPSRCYFLNMLSVLGVLKIFFYLLLANVVVGLAIEKIEIGKSDFVSANKVTLWQIRCNIGKWDTILANKVATLANEKQLWQIRCHIGKWDPTVANETTVAN